MVKEADAYVVVTPEYNHQPPPGLTNLMNYFGSSAYAYVLRCNPNPLPWPAVDKKKTLPSSLPSFQANALNHLCVLVHSRYKPSAMVSYSAGNWGGVRAAVGLRSFLGELGCIAVSASVPIPRAWRAFDADGGLAEESQVKAIDRMLDQLEWHAVAMRNQRNA